MTEIDDILESIKSAEIQNNDSINPSRLGQIYICKTSELISSTHIVSDTASKKFIPSIILKVFITCFFVLLLILFSDQSFISKDATDPLPVIFLLLFAIAAITQLYLFIVDKNRNFKILIDKEGITVAKVQYKWRDIRETAILYLPVKRDQTNYLIILFKDNTYKKFDLSNFRSIEGFKKTISKYIEYFKPIS